MSTSKLSSEPAIAVVGVDEKEPADFAVAAAHALAEPLKLSVELVHAAPVPLDYFSHVDPLGIERARAAAAQRWSKLLDGAGVSASSIAASLEIVPGKPAEVLVEQARTRGAELIVLGRHQKRAALDFGDVVRDVVVHADRAVWV